MDSLKKAISYSLKPHELGYCGPCEVEESGVKLKKYAAGENIPEQEIIDLLNEFKGAVAYYRLIARINNIEDIYDERVVGAYWLGNELLDKITVKDIAEMARAEFVGHGLLTLDKIEKKISQFPEHGVAHHTFHIFFIGAVTNRVKLSGDTRDKCRPNWGVIRDIFSAKNKVIVNGVKLFPQKEEVKMEVIWDKTFVADLAIGDKVSFHWGRISEKISDKEWNNLVKYTMINYHALMKAYAEKNK